MSATRSEAIVDRLVQGGLSRRGFLGATTAGIGLAALGALTGCGSSSGGGANGKITALYYYPAGGAGDKAFRQLAAKFKKRSGGHDISFQLAPVASYNAALTSGIRSETLPDLVWLLGGTNNAAGWSAMDPVTSSSAGSLFNQVFNWNSAQIFPDKKTEYFGVPVGTQGFVWYYNKAVYRKAGLDPNKPPTTWAEFAHNCDKIKQSGTAPIGMGGTDGYTALFMGWVFAPLYYSAVEARDFYTGKRKYTDTRYGQLLRLLQSTYTSGWWNSDYKGKNSSGITADFVAGKVGHLPGLIRGILDWGTYDTTALRNGYGMFPGPVTTDANDPTLQMSVEADAVLAVNRRSKNKKAVNDAIRFLAEPDSQRVLLNVAGLMPNRKDIDVTTATESAGGRAIYEALRTFPQSTAAAYMGGPSAVAALMQTELTQVLAGGDIAGFQGRLTDTQGVSIGPR